MLQQPINAAFNPPVRRWGRLYSRRRLGAPPAVARTTGANGRRQDQHRKI